MSAADLKAIARRWSSDGGMGNPRSAEDYTDAGCRILADHAFRDVAVLLDRIRQLEADLVDAHRDALVNRDTANAAHQTIERVRALHVRAPMSLTCDGCYAKWPCRTVAALDAEAPL